MMENTTEGMKNARRLGQDLPPCLRIEQHQRRSPNLRQRSPLPNCVRTCFFAKWRHSSGHWIPIISTLGMDSCLALHLSIYRYIESFNKSCWRSFYTLITTNDYPETLQNAACKTSYNVRYIGLAWPKMFTQLLPIAAY